MPPPIRYDFFQGQEYGEASKALSLCAEFKGIPKNPVTKINDVLIQCCSVILEPEVEGKIGNADLVFI